MNIKNLSLIVGLVFLGVGCRVTTAPPAVPTPTTTAPVVAKNVDIAQAIENDLNYQALTPPAFTLKASDCVSKEAWQLWQKTFTAPKIWTQEIGGVKIFWSTNEQKLTLDALLAKPLACSINVPHIAGVTAEKIYWVQDCGIDYTEPAAADYAPVAKTPAQVECERVGKLVSDYFGKKSLEVPAAPVTEKSNKIIVDGQSVTPNTEYWGTWIHPVYKFSMTLPLGVVAEIQNGAGVVFQDPATKTSYASIQIMDKLPAISGASEKYTLAGVTATLVHKTDAKDASFKIDQLWAAIPNTKKVLFFQSPAQYHDNEFDFYYVLKSFKWQK